MRFSFSSGGKFRIRTRRISYSNRGGVRVRVGRGLSVGKTGLRYSVKAGPLRYSTGKTGTRVAAVAKAGPFYAGVNSSGSFVGVQATVGTSGRRVSKATSAAGQRRALAAGMVVPQYALNPQLLRSTDPRDSIPDPPTSRFNQDPARAARAKARTQPAPAAAPVPAKSEPVKFGGGTSQEARTKAYLRSRGIR